MIVYGKNRHLERRLPVSGRERGPLCHPERELWISADVGRDPKLALRMTGILSKYLRKEDKACISLNALHII